MDKFVEILVGLILVAVSAYVALPTSLGGTGIAVLSYPVWFYVKTVLIGGITLGVFLVGLLFLLLGIMDLKG